MGVGEVKTAKMGRPVEMHQPGITDLSRRFAHLFQRLLRRLQMLPAFAAQGFQESDQVLLVSIGQF